MLEKSSVRIESILRTGFLCFLAALAEIAFAQIDSLQVDVRTGGEGLAAGSQVLLKVFVRGERPFVYDLAQRREFAAGSLSAIQVNLPFSAPIEKFHRFEIEFVPTAGDVWELSSVHVHNWRRPGERMLPQQRVGQTFRDRGVWVSVPLSTYVGSHIVVTVSTGRPASKAAKCKAYRAKPAR